MLRRLSYRRDMGRITEVFLGPVFQVGRIRPLSACGIIGNRLETRPYLGTKVRGLRSRPLNHSAQAVTSLLDLLDEEDEYELEEEDELFIQTNNISHPKLSEEKPPHEEDIPPRSKGWKTRRELSNAMFDLHQQVVEDTLASSDDSELTDELSSIFGDEPKMSAKQAAPIKLQTRDQAELLFDSIAPYITKRQLNSLLARMKRFGNNGSTQSDDNQIEEQEQPQSKIKTSASFLFHVDKHFKKDAPWIRPLVTHFLIGGDISQFVSGKPKFTSKPAKHKRTKNKAEKEPSIKGDKSLSQAPNQPVWLEPSFPPNQNRATFERDAKTLLRAREKAAMTPLFWRSSVRTALRTNDASLAPDLTSKDLEAVEQIQQSAQTLFSAKSESAKLQDAEEMVLLLSDRLPRYGYIKLMAMLGKYAPKEAKKSNKCKGDSKDAKNTNKRQGESQDAKLESGTSIKSLESRLNHALGWHIHLVALDLAQFLFVHIPSGTVNELNNRRIVKVDSETINTDSITKDRLVCALDEWNATRSTFVQAILESQKAYAQRPPLPPQKKTRTEIIQELIPELDSLRTKCDGTSVGTDMVLKPPRGRPTIGRHCSFEALTLRDDLLPKLTEEYDPIISRSVFVNNLPIDVTEEELALVFGKCGALEQIQIFNQRPDLDPGPLSKVELALRAKERRGRVRNNAPISPVHARLVFQDENGRNAATCPSLSIFGMILRKHPCRPLLPNMTKLYISNIPDGVIAVNLGKFIIT